jgi:hypothetical protein
MAFYSKGKLSFFVASLCVANYVRAADELSTPTEAALMAVCDFQPAPKRNATKGDIFNSEGQLKSPSWNKNWQMWEFKASFAGKGYRGAYCTQYLLQKLVVDQGNKAKGKDFCEDNKVDILRAVGGDSAVASDASFGSLGDLFSRAGSAGDGDKRDPCDPDGMPDENRFACAYLTVKEEINSGSGEKAAAKQVMSYCRKLGADMQSITRDQYRSLSNSGVDSFGGAYCGPYGAVQIVERPDTLTTIGNVTLGLAKVLGPTFAMWDISKRQQANARAAIDGNRALGFPSVVTAGQGGGFGYGIGGGACGGGGMGGCGGHYGGNGGAFYPGAGYSGHGGGCPIGACYGNGGVVVGGGVPFNPGMGGGACGVPPYAPGYVGCGGGFGGGIGVPGFGGGMYYPGGGGGAYGGGYNPYGSGGGAGGAGGLPGPYGTGNGGNGYNPYGAGSPYGGPQQYGAQNPYNSQYMEAQAQMYQAYAAQVARQAKMQAAAAKTYQNTLDDLESVQKRSYQAYTAYQMAQYGYNMPGQVGGFASSGQSYSGSVPGGRWSGGGYPVQPVYYPPYQSSGSRFSVGVGVNYSSGGSRAAAGR